MRKPGIQCYDMGFLLTLIPSNLEMALSGRRARRVLSDLNALNSERNTHIQETCTGRDTSYRETNLLISLQSCLHHHPSSQASKKAFASQSHDDTK